MPYIDFQEVKRRVSIHEAAQKLGLMLKQEKNQWRGMCPSCQAGGDRALVLTPERGLFYCFAAKAGGDCIALVAHITGVDAQEAAHFLLPEEQELTRPQKPGVPSAPASTAAPPVGTSKRPEGFDADAYLDKLDYQHDQVKALGLTEEEARELGVGFSSTGFHRNTLVFAVRWPSGEIAGFMAAENIKFPKRLQPMKIVHLRRA